MKTIHRRTLITRVAPAALATVALPTLTVPALARGGAERALSFRHLHTGETLSAVYRTGTGYDRDGLAKINHMLRDWRSDEVARMDPALLELLSDLRHLVDSNESFEIISGYRSPKTNAMLRGRSRGVAKRSQHMLAKAVDVRLPGTDLAKLRDAAKALKRGGVGYYRRSGFIHVDTGRVRSW